MTTPDTADFYGFPKRFWFTLSNYGFFRMRLGY
jgi:hypothetical protein